MKLFSPVEPKPWHFFLIAVLAVPAGGFFILIGLDLLLAGNITYTKSGFSPRTVSPSDGAFEFYYQVAFMFSLGGVFVLLGLLSATAALLKLDLPQSYQAALKRLSAAMAWSLVILGGTWIVLHGARYWLI